MESVHFTAFSLVLNIVCYFSCVAFVFFLDQFEKHCPSPFSSYQSLFEYISSLLKIVSWCSLILRKLSICCNMALKKTLIWPLPLPPGLALLGQSSLSDSAHQSERAFSCCWVFVCIAPSAQNTFYSLILYSVTFLFLAKFCLFFSYQFIFTSFRKPVMPFLCG